MNKHVQEPLAVSKRMVETLMAGQPEQLQVAVADCIDAEIRPLVEALKDASPLIIAGESFEDEYRMKKWNAARAALERATE